MNKSQKMADLARSIGAVPSTESQEAVKPETQKTVKLSHRRQRPRAERATAETEKRPRRSAAGLKQMTIKLEPDVRGRLLQESLRRKAADVDNWPIQQIVTEAVNAYLGGK
jgi:Ni/Co efflux regulator RcnB